MQLDAIEKAELAEHGEQQAAVFTALDAAVKGIPFPCKGIKIPAGLPGLFAHENLYPAFGHIGRSRQAADTGADNNSVIVLLAMVKSGHRFFSHNPIQQHPG